MDPAHNHVDWSQRYRDEQTPWDRGRAHAELQARIDSGQLAAPHAGATCFVPGCGRGHDALALAKAGWKVTAMDIVDELESTLNAALRPHAGEFLVGDALRPNSGPYDMVWEHTFLCAISPEDRVHWSRMVSDCLKSGGRLAVLIFPANKPPSEGGPPWGYNAQVLGEWLGDGFELIETAAVDPSLEPRNWDQAFAIFQKA
ncbi:MAG: SAM-dependent methyltransferase [Candidatus Paceibacteria bacterium]|jgi:SAM-dependent methyltransferase